MAAGKRVCPVPCARTREKRTGRNNENVEHVMVGKQESGRVRLGLGKAGGREGRNREDGETAMLGLLERKDRSER